MVKPVRQPTARKEPHAVRVDEYASAAQSQLPYRWNHEFGTRRNLDHGMENTPHVVTQAELHQQIDDEEPPPKPGRPDPMIRIFMKDADDWDLCMSHVHRLESFCSTATLGELINEKGAANVAPVAWLDERGFVGGQMRPRTQRGPLTQRELYLELLKPRFALLESELALRPNRKSGARSTANRRYPLSRDNESDEPNAERRLIFITDLDPWSVLALVGTASYNQSSALRDALYRHVQAEAHIGVTTPTIGQSMFQLSFHMPYFVWRPEGYIDSYKATASGRAWARPKRVSPPGWRGKETGGFISGYQFSCVVTGSDYWRWVSYAFADTYHDGPYVGTELLQDYYTDSLADEGSSKDPTTLGQRDADDPIRDPRLYFLVVVQLWVRRIERESQQVVSHMQCSVQEYQERAPASADGEKPNEGSLRQSLDWVIYNANLAKKLSESLSKTVRACNIFRRDYVGYFENLPGSGNHLAALRNSFSELERMKHTLDDLEGQCHGFAETFKMQLSVDTNRMGEGQHAIALHSNSLATMMMFLTPPMMAATMFSMNKEVISFMSLSFQSFIGITVGFWAVILIVYLALNQQFRADCCAVFSSMESRLACPPLPRDRVRWLRPFRRDDPTEKRPGDLEDVGVCSP